jgi:hypothetical protein
LLEKAMTPFTAFHTLLSLLPVGFGFAALVRHGQIDSASRLGKWYIGTMLAGTVSAFGFLPTIGFTPGQVLTVVTLGLLLVGTVTPGGRWRTWGYTQAAALTTSFLLLMVFLTTEVLKKVPVGHPFASGPADPSLIPVRLTLLAAYVGVLGFQVLKIRAVRSRAARRAANVLAAA